jgi:hypothetical protein
MSTSSNSYAEKILAEHPLAMWSLDDQSYFLSQISESDRQISTWTGSGGSATTVTDTSAPFSSSYVTRITGSATPVYGANARVYLASTSTFSSNTFTISFYLKTQYVTEISAGYGNGNIANISTVTWSEVSRAIPAQTPTGTTNISISVGAGSNYIVGEYVNISGVTPTAYNGNWQVQAGSSGSTLIVNIGYNPGAITNSSGLAKQRFLQFTTSSNHGFSAGDYVEISGVTPDNYDGNGIVSSTGLTTNSFRLYNNVSNQGSGSGGTASSNKTQSTYINPADYPIDSWIPISFTFNDNVFSQKILLSFTYSQTNPQFFVNGLTIGKDSQPFNGESLGQTSITIPENIATTLTTAIEAKSYGTQEYSGYYICDSTNIYAKNSGVSMAYGSDTSMRIYPYSTAGQPSFLFPGFGMLNDIGRYKTLTLQALIRITANNSIPKRIIGPLASTDGVYITKDIISLKIGDSIGSFHLSEMYRPMILQIKIGNGFAKLSIDGEELISLQIDNSTLSLPEKLNGSSKNQDWFGIYAYIDIPLIEIGSLAIFPYESSESLAKLNLVYAQSVILPTISNSSSGQTISPDFALSNYVNNYNYPSFQAKWEQATISENLDILENGALSAKQYTKPALTTSLYDSSKLLLDLYETYVASGESNTFINLKPSTVVSGSGRSWSSNQGYLSVNLYGDADYLSSCIYGVFKSLESSATEQILLKIKNILNNNYFQVSIINTTVYYKYKYANGTETQITTKSITQNTTFAIGFDIQKLILTNSDLSDFFSNKTNLQIFIGGQDTLLNTFSGNIYKVGFCTIRNSVDISSLFDSGGILTNSSSYSSLLSKIASYTVYSLNAFGKINLDTGTTGYWQDYVPLTKLAKTVVNTSGQESIALDFVQINLDYEEPRSYSSGNFVTSGLPIRGYVTFQTLSSGANKDLTNFGTTQSASATRTINASTFSATTKYEFVNGMIVYPPTNVDISTLAMVLHLDVSTEASTIKPARIRFLQLAAQSFNKNMPNKLGTKYAVNLYPYIYNVDVSNTAPTHPYDYNSQNPYLMYKQASPHLYLTRHSGFRVVGTLSNANQSFNHRGIYADIGDLSPDKKITSLQLSMLADFESFPTSSTNIFEIKTNSVKINFTILAVNGDTSKAVISTDSTIPLIYYLNGRKVGLPVIRINEWNTLGISFIEPLDISNNKGKISIKHNMLINDISCHYANPIELDQKSEPLLWSQIDNNKWRIPVPIQTPTRVGNSITLTTTGDHNLVVGEKLTFYDIQPSDYGSGFGGSALKISRVNTSSSFTYENSNAPTTAITTAGTVVGTWEYATIPNYYALYGSSPDSIYDQFTGRNKIIIDTQIDSPVMQLNEYEYLAYMDIETNTFILDIR